MDKLGELAVKAVYEKWHSAVAPAILVLGTIAFFVLVGIVAFGLVALPTVAYGLFLLACPFVLAYWFFQHRFPKGKPNKVVFVIAVRAETAAEEILLRRDFAVALAETVQETTGGSQFEFIELPSYQAAGVTDIASATRVMHKCRGHFLVFGDIRTRKVSGDHTYAIHLEGLVSHSHVQQQVRQLLASDMRAVLPRKVDIPQKHELRGFEVTTALMGAGARYTIATAALISGALDLSESLLRGLQREKIPAAGRHANLKKQAENLRRLVPIRLADVYSNQCDRWFQQWRDDRSVESLSRVATYNELFGQVSRDRYKYLNFKAILAFVTSRDPEKALAILLSIKNPDSIAPHVRYSIAFLQAFKGQMSLAERAYNTAFSLDKDGAAAFEVEEFIAWIAAEYPDKPQLHYCLGLINLKGKKDVQLAVRDFRRFLAGVSEGQFDSQVRIAKGHVAGFATTQVAANDTVDVSNVIALRATGTTNQRQ